MRSRPMPKCFSTASRIGSARELIARALPVTRGRHAIAVLAPGFRPYIAQFDADPSFPTRVRVVLVPE